MRAKGGSAPRDAGSGESGTASSPAVGFIRFAVELRKPEHERGEVEYFLGERHGADRVTNREGQQHGRERQEVNEQRIRPRIGVGQVILPKVRDVQQRAM